MERPDVEDVTHTDTCDALFAAARQAQTMAYARYSGFGVGAAILGESGRIFAGCNVENASYPVGTCAEAGAVAAMIAAGDRRICEIAIIGDGEEPCRPCGACRQRILEFVNEATIVHAGSMQGGRIESFALTDLLPHAFEPDRLK